MTWKALLRPYPSFCLLRPHPPSKKGHPVGRSSYDPMRANLCFAFVHLFTVSVNDPLIAFGFCIFFRWKRRGIKGHVTRHSRVEDVGQKDSKEKGGEKDHR